MRPSSSRRRPYASRPCLLGLAGAVIAALVLGVLNSYAEYQTSSSLGKAIVFVFVVVVLQFRPNGLVSFRTRGLTA